MNANKIGSLSIMLTDAALVARAKGDDVHAIFFAIKAAETLALAKALGWDGGALTPAERATKSAPPVVSSLPSGESDPSAMSDCGGADTALPHADGSPIENTEGGA